MQEDWAGWGSPQVAYMVKQQIKEHTTNFFTLILLKGKTAVHWPNPTNNPSVLGSTPQPIANKGHGGQGRGRGLKIYNKLLPYTCNT